MVFIMRNKDRFGSVWIGLDWFGSVRFGSVQVAKIGMMKSTGPHARPHTTHNVSTFDVSTSGVISTFWSDLD